MRFPFVGQDFMDFITYLPNNNTTNIIYFNLLPRESSTILLIITDKLKKNTLLEKSFPGKMALTRRI